MEILKAIKQKANKFIKQNGKMPIGIKIIIGWYFSFVVISFFAYFALAVLMIVYNAGKLSDLLALLKELTSVTMVGAVIAIAKMFVDADGDGLPDSLETENKDRRRDI